MNLHSTHDPYLVGLSVVIAMTASYVALDLAGRVTASQGKIRLGWLIGGAVAMGTGIWSMHFTAMLAFSLPIAVFYHVPTVLFSLLAAVTASFVALIAVSGRTLSVSRLVAGGMLMGMGIVVMHYSGMDAMRMQADTHYDPLLWTLSAVVAVAVSLVGLMLVFHFGKATSSAWSWQKVVCAVVMGAAIPSMHYTAMSAASFTPTEGYTSFSQTVAVSWVGGTAIIFGTFLVLGITFTLPGRGRRQAYAWLPALRALSIIATLTIGGVALNYIEERMVKDTGASLALAATSIADKLNLSLYERYAAIEVMAEAAVLKQHDAATKSAFLHAMKEAYPDYAWLAVTDAHGRLIAASNPASVGEDRSGREWFQFVRDQKKIHVRDAEASEDSGGIITVAFTAPILSGDKFLGAVTTRVSVPQLEEVFKATAHAIQIHQESIMTVEYQFMNRDGDVIADSILREEGKVNLKHLGLPSALLSASAEPGFIEETHVRRQIPVVTGYAMTRGYRNFPGLHWGVLVRIDRDRIVAPIHSFLFTLGVIGAAVFLPLIGFLVWATGRLRHAEEWHRLLLQSTTEGMWCMDVNGRLTFINGSGAQMLGYVPEELIGKHMHTLTHHTRPDGSPYPAQTCPIQRTLQTGESFQMDREVFWRKDGTSFPVECTSSPIISDGTIKGAVVICTDITDRQRAEDEQKQLRAQLLQNDKMAGVGQLAAGVAHEINNPIGFVKSNLNTLHEYIRDMLVLLKSYEGLEAAIRAKPNRHSGEPEIALADIVNTKQKIQYDTVASDLEPLLTESREGIERVREIVQNLKEFSRVDEGTHKHADINRCLKSTLHMVWNELKYKAELIEEYGVIPEILCAAGELNQVFMNLLVNAGQAIAVQGRITIKTYEKDNAIFVEISDTGCGIPPQNLERIFEPFFTTKDVGKGTGLGLSISYGIVQKHKGRLEVESTLGQGTTFRVCLPIDNNGMTHAPLLAAQSDWT